MKVFITSKIVTLTLFVFLSHFVDAQFTNVSAATGTNHGGNKDGGVGWADFNNDGCLDLIFNTTDNSTGMRSRLLFSDCNLPNPSFTDVTATNANGLRLQEAERSISIGDYNNDGHIDFARNRSNRFEVYLNKGPLATPAYSFGDAVQNPNFVITAIINGMNVEGFGWMDYDNDGWLDLIVENHNFGIDIYQNPADGTANFLHVTPNTTPLGLPTGGTNGDYMALCDYDDDGDVDILARKRDEFDLWTNTGAGTFGANATFNEQASNGNKGGVLFCDFDNDGDFDIFWSDNGVNQIFLQTGVSSGNFVASGEPVASSGVTPTGNIDGCSCGDVDNDGDLDLFLGANSGTSFLYLNNGGMNFTRSNLGINANVNTEGNSFGDYDNDGDLDLYINVNGGNQLWRNGTNNTNYIKVNVKRDLGGGVYRDDLGATAVLKDCFGNITSGIRQVSSVEGHGSNSPAVIHFGLPLGNNVGYLLEVRFTTISGTRLILDTAFVPSFIPNQTLTIISPTSANSLFDGCLFVLPIELLSFEANVNGDKVDLKWVTTSEINNDYFTIERSVDVINWEEILVVNGAGNSNQMIDYIKVDYKPMLGISYYRLKQTDFNGAYSYSGIVPVKYESNTGNNINLFPSMISGGETLNIEFNDIFEAELLVVLRDVRGREFYSKIVVNVEDGKSIGILIGTHIPSGIYLITATSENQMYSQKLIIK